MSALAEIVKAVAGRGAAVLRDHWPFLAVLVLATLLRVVAWFAVRPAWWIIGDSIGYLRVAMTHQPESWRPGGYPGMVLLPLWPFHQLALVTAVQHLMGVCSGALVYAITVRLGVPRWAGVLAALPALFDGYVIASEQMIAAEALFGLLVVGSLALLLSGERRQLLSVAAGGLLLGLSATTRIVGLPLIGVAVMTLLLRRARWSHLVALCVAFALPLGLYSLWFDQYFGRFDLTASSGVFLYGRTTNFVECHHVHFSTEQVGRLCPAEPVGRRDEVNLVFGSTTPLASTHLHPAAMNSLALEFALEAIRAQPVGYAALAWDGLVKSFAWDQTGQPMDIRFEIPEATSGELQLIAARYQQGIPAGPTYQPQLVTALAAYQDVLSVRGTLSLLALVLAVAGMLFGRDPDHRGLRAAASLTAGTVAVLVLVPAATAIVAPRYRVPAIPVLGLAAVLGATLLWNRSSAHRRLAHPRPADSPGPPVARGSREAGGGT
ncbi:MAG TPA: hypothetical protein VGO86_18970 [Candidatus Dormibacteraeota bacterium]